MPDGRTILLVDSDEQLVALVKPLLDSKYNVLRASGGKEALDLLKKESIELVITGEQLTDIDGIGFIAKLRQAAPKVKTVFISSVWRDANLYQQLTKTFNVSLVVHRPLKPLLFSAQVDAELNATDKLATEQNEEEAYMALRVRFARALPNRLEKVLESVERAQAAPHDAELLKEARRLAHNLKGTSSSCAFEMVGSTAAQLEQVLDDMIRKQHSGDSLNWELIEKLLQTLKLNAEHDLSRHADIKDISEEALTVIEDSSLAKVLVVGKQLADHSSELPTDQRFPCKIVLANNGGEAIEKADKTSLDAVLIDMRDDSNKSFLQLARDLRGMPGYENLPMGFVVDQNGADDRVAMTHAGASLYLDTPVGAESLNSAIQYLVHLRGRPRVLIVDDDEDFTALIEAALGKEGMLVRSLHDPTEVISTLQDFNPDLLLLDVMMPATSGYEVCRLLRSQARWQDLPILFLTAQTGLDARLAAFDSGGDDYLPKPVATVELLARVRVRLERVRLLKERADRDILTGLLLRRAFMEQISALLAESQRHNFAFSLSLMDVDHFKKVNDSYGHFAGDRVLSEFGQLLRKRFRVEDLRGRWGGEEFVMAFRHEGKATMAGALQRVLEELHSLNFTGDHGETFNVTFSAGLVSFPEDGQTIEDLMRVADARLYAAKEAGRNRIVSTDMVVSV